MGQPPPTVKATFAGSESNYNNFKKETLDLVGPTTYPISSRADTPQQFKEFTHRISKEKDVDKKASYETQVFAWRTEDHKFLKVMRALIIKDSLAWVTAFPSTLASDTVIELPGALAFARLTLEYGPKQAHVFDMFLEEEVLLLC